MLNNNYYMTLALEEAKKGIGFTSPNPMVGAVIVKNDKILSTGFHRKSGEKHAEINAIDKLKPEELKDSTIYVTLEPCCHYGKTPPCTDAIIKSGIKNVIIGAKDEDERVKDKSIDILKKAGINVISGVLENESKELNFIYYFNKKHKRPYIVLKSALTLDGKIASCKGNSKWISNDKSREIVHKLRLRLKAIACGKNTILTDKPKLNCRLENYENKPVDKLIFSNEKLPVDCFASNPGTCYSITNEISKSKDNFIIFCNEKEIDSILVEGGAGVYSWFLKNRLADCIYLFYKPAFLGNDGISVFNNTGIKQINELEEYSIIDLKIIENNFLLLLSNGESPCLQV